MVDSNDIGNASKIVTDVSIWFSSTINNVTSWIGRINAIEWVFIIAIIIIGIVLLYLRGKIKGKLSFGRPKKLKFFN